MLILACSFLWGKCIFVFTILTKGHEKLPESMEKDNKYTYIIKKAFLITILKTLTAELSWRTFKVFLNGFSPMSQMSLYFQNQSVLVVDRNIFKLLTNLWTKIFMDGFAFLIDIKFFPTMGIFPALLHNYSWTSFLKEERAVFHLQEAFTAVTSPARSLRAVGNNHFAGMCNLGLGDGQTLASSKMEKLVFLQPIPLLINIGQVAHSHIGYFMTFINTLLF